MSNASRSTTPTFRNFMAGGSQAKLSAECTSVIVVCCG